MQFGAGVTSSRETAPSKDSGGDSEVAAVFLDEQIGRGFRDSEQGVRALVDRKRFVNSVFRETMVGFDFESALFFDEGELVR